MTLGASGDGVPAALRAGVLVEELGDLLRVLADHDVGRHDRARRSRRCGSRTARRRGRPCAVEVRAVGALAAGELALRLGAVGVRATRACGSREQRSLKRVAPCARTAARDIDLAAPAARRDQPTRAAALRRSRLREGAGRSRRRHSIRRPVWMRATDNTALVGVLALALPGCGGDGRARPCSTATVRGAQPLVIEGRRVHVRSRPRDARGRRPPRRKVTLDNAAASPTTSSARRRREIGGAAELPDGREPLADRVASRPGTYSFVCTVGRPRRARHDAARSRSARRSHNRRAANLPCAPAAAGTGDSRRTLRAHVHIGGDTRRRRGDLFGAGTVPDPAQLRGEALAEAQHGAGAARLQLPPRPSASDTARARARARRTRSLAPAARTKRPAVATSKTSASPAS